MEKATGCNSQRVSLAHDPKHYDPVQCVSSKAVRGVWLVPAGYTRPGQPAAAAGGGAAAASSRPAAAAGELCSAGEGAGGSRGTVQCLARSLGAWFL